MPFSTPNYLCNQNRASVWNGKTAILCMQCTFSTSIRIPNRANLKSSESDIEPCWCTSVLNSLSTVCHSKFYEYFKIYIHTHTHTHRGHSVRFELKIQSQRCLYTLLETVFALRYATRGSTLCRFISFLGSNFKWLPANFCL